MKKYLLGIFAVVLALGFSAFTSPKKSAAVLTGEKWFHFVGDATDAGDLANPNMYVLDGTGSTNTICEEDDLDYRCEILIKPQAGGTKPDLDNFDPIAEVTRSTPE